MSSNTFPVVAMVRHSNLPVLRQPRPIGARWKKLSLIAASGALLGAALVAWELRSTEVPVVPEKPVRVVAAQPDTTPEVERLRARNRRLEVLVETLRKRPGHSEVLEK